MDDAVRTAAVRPYGRTYGRSGTGEVPPDGRMGRFGEFFDPFLWAVVRYGSVSG